MIVKSLNRTGLLCPWAATGTISLPMDEKKENREIAFLVDRMLGKLATYLIMLGYDAAYCHELDSTLLVERAQREQRIILSRDTKLFQRSHLPEALFIEDDIPAHQLKQVIRHFDLKPEPQRFFTRCLRCNRRLRRAVPQEVMGMIPSYVFSVHQEFFRCPQCGRVYWKGSHRKQMEERIRTILDV